MRLAPLAVLTALLSAGPALAQPTVRVELTPREITVGDPIVATVILDGLDAPLAEAPRFPAWQETWGDAEVREVGEIQTARGPDGRTFYTQTLHLTAFQTGDITLPPLAITLPGAETRRVSTPGDVAFSVRSVLPVPPPAEGDAGEEAGEGATADESLTPRPAAPPRKLGGQQSFWWTTALLTGLCALAALLVVRRREEIFSGTAAKPRLPPIEELRARLATVDPGGAGEPVHTAISLALRTYLGRRLAIRAAEATTSEIQRNLRPTAVPPALGKRAVELLRACDGVKFARLTVAPEVSATRLRQAEGIAEEVETLVRAAEEEAAAAAAEGSAKAGQEAAA